MVDQLLDRYSGEPSYTFTLGITLLSRSQDPVIFGSWGWGILGGVNSDIAPNLRTWFFYEASAYHRCKGDLTIPCE